MRRPVQAGEGEAVALSLHLDARAGQGNAVCFHTNRQASDGRFAFCFPGEVVPPEIPAVGGVQAIMFQQRQTVRVMAAGQRDPADAASVRPAQRTSVEQEGGGKIEGERVFAVDPHLLFPGEIVPVAVRAQLPPVHKVLNTPGGNPPYKIDHKALRTDIDRRNTPLRLAPGECQTDGELSAGMLFAGPAFARGVQIKIDLPLFLLLSCHGISVPPSRKCLWIKYGWAGGRIAAGSKFSVRFR